MLWDGFYSDGYQDSTWTSFLRSYVLDGNNGFKDIIFHRQSAMTRIRCH